MSITYFQAPPRLVCGPGAVSQTGAEAACFGTKALIVTGRHSSKKSGALDAVTDSLSAAGVTPVVFNQVPSDPDVDTVENGAAMAREQGCDVIIALGGGSPMDAAKGISVVLGNNAKVTDFEFKLPEKPGPVIIAIPTTAGTGSEISHVAVITDVKRKLKMPIHASFMVPAVSILDPELTYSMPPDFTAATGLDALTHATEAFLSTKATPLTDIHALAAVELIGQNLVPATLNGKNTQARENMLLGAMEAGCAFGNASTCLVHSMARPLGAHFHVPHGKANGMLLATVMEFNRPARPERMAALAETLGENIEGLSVREAGMLAVDALRAIFEETGLPRRLSDWGVKEQDLDVLAKDALESTTTAFNPRVPTLGQIRELYAKIL